jgi:two-component system, NarL family, invasion response regulator UvrY
LNAMRKVAAGGNFISPEFAGDLAFGLILREDGLPHEALSDREMQMFHLLAAGLGGSEIAQKLNLSPKTVSTYKKRILEKMQLANLADLIRYAMKHELLNGTSGR